MEKVLNVKQMELFFVFLCREKAKAHTKTFARRAASLLRIPWLQMSIIEKED
jgi:hypothetical protein